MFKGHSRTPGTRTTPTTWKGCLVTLLATSLVGCGSLTYEVEGPPPPGPKEGEARVTFAFNQGFPAGAAYITEKGKLLCFLQNNEHCVVDVPAGKHMFMMLSTNDEALDGEFAAGKNYQIRVYSTPGVWGTHTYWTPLKNSGEDLETRKEDVDDTDLVALHPEKAAEWEHDEADELKEREMSFKTGKDKPSHTVGPEHAL